MSKKAWAAFAYPEKAYNYAGAALKKNWERLHRGDAEPFPADEALQEAWRLFHQGEFHKAAEAGLAAGADGHTVAAKATAIYANYLEKDEARKMELFQEVARRAEAQQKARPDEANAWYFHAYALGRYSQGISVVTALAQGLGGKIKESLTRAIKLQPRHADAHIALGAYHAEVIDKVGAMVGGLTYGAKKDEGVRLFETALKLNPDSTIARIEYANGLVMMFGKDKLDQASKLYVEAAACEPADAMERLDVELAKSELEE
jgi:tetratricopeptide (TPR) repeat protein